MAVIGRPPGLAVGHQSLEVVLERAVVERVEGLGIIEVGAHRIGRKAALVEDLERKLLRPPVAVGPPEKRSNGRRLVHRATAHLTGLRVHDRLSF
jgi:hypothetical protein